MADFGVARFQNQGGVMTAETGTYRWMAPEVGACCISPFTFYFLRSFVFNHPINSLATRSSSADLLVVLQTVHLDTVLFVVTSLFDKLEHEFFMPCFPTMSSIKL